MRGSSSVLRIPVPDELHNSLNTRTLPIWASVNTRNHRSILVYKIRCIYLQDYSLLKLVTNYCNPFYIIAVVEFAFLKVNISIETVQLQVISDLITNAFVITLNEFSKDNAELLILTIALIL
uniref:Uncharacterized protein n=1 Tax=Vespula pensylvanica TaxID=30213 RepID=A0A834KTL6_VESPE|nr:hypothetical protein H0235_012604 [Vespula pensylvanica]